MNCFSIHNPVHICLANQLPTKFILRARQLPKDQWHSATIQNGNLIADLRFLRNKADQWSLVTVIYFWPKSLMVPNNIPNDHKEFFDMVGYFGVQKFFNVNTRTCALAD